MLQMRISIRKIFNSDLIKIRRPLFIGRLAPQYSGFRRYFTQRFISKLSRIYGPDPIAGSIRDSSSLAWLLSNQACDLTGKPPTIGMASLFDAWSENVT